MIEVSGQHHGTGFCEIHEQDLVSRRVPGRGDDSNASVGENVVIAVEQNSLGVLERAEEIRIVSPDRISLRRLEGSLIFGPLNQKR